MEFEPFPKIGRLQRGITISEKIDGTNAQIGITLAPYGLEDERAVAVSPPIIDEGEPSQQLMMYAGSRSRWVQPGKSIDNFGFAGWCVEHQEELFKLGEGRHFGEWWGGSIQRGYDRTNKRFSLFNVNRWADARPICCDVVPVLYRGAYDQVQITEALRQLQDCGSVAAPGFMNPEGIVIFHEATRTLFKQTLKDDAPKGQTE